MERVKLCGRRMVEMVEVEGRKNLVPREIAEKFEEYYSKAEEWMKEGIRHRLDTRGEKFAEFIGEWLYGGFFSLIMNGGHAWKEYLLTSNMQIGPAFVRKYTIHRGMRYSRTEFGWLPEDPKLGLSYAEKDWRDVKPIPEWDLKEESNTKKNPINNGCCDVHMNWSSDINYPYCFAHVDDPYVFHFIWREAYEEGYTHPSPTQVPFKLASAYTFRLFWVLGHLNPKIPGRQVRFRHRMKLEKPNMQPDVWTEYEWRAMKEWATWKSAFEAFMEDEENRKYFKEKFGCETLDELLEKLKKGELKHLEAAPGVRTYLLDERPNWTPFMRIIYWWDENYKVDPKTGYITNFGEFEPENMIEMLVSMGFPREQAEKVAKADEPLDHYKPARRPE
ncbi:hypothetical protein [Archaeoglobus sp.]